jgi:hypothetical protein
MPKVHGVLAMFADRQISAQASVATLLVRHWKAAFSGDGHVEIYIDTAVAAVTMFPCQLLQLLVLSD